MVIIQHESQQRHLLFFLIISIANRPWISPKKRKKERYSLITPRASATKNCMQNIMFAQRSLLSMLIIKQCFVSISAGLLFSFLFSFSLKNFTIKGYSVCKYVSTKLHLSSWKHTLYCSTVKKLTASCVKSHETRKRQR